MLLYYLLLPDKSNYIAYINVVIKYAIHNCSLYLYGCNLYH